MQLINVRSVNAGLVPVIETMTKFMEEKGISNDVTIGGIAGSEVNANSDVLYMAKDLGNNKGHIVKVFVLTGTLKDKMRKIGDDNSPNQIILPAVPRDVCASPRFRKAVKAEVVAKLKADANKLVLLAPSATPIHLDLGVDANVINLFGLMYNEIAQKYLASTGQTPALEFKVGPNGEKEKLEIAVVYNTSEETKTDEFGMDVRSDITVTLGKMDHTNDFLDNAALSTYGVLHAYMDALYIPKQVQTSQFEPPRNLPYLARLIMRHFEGPDGHASLGHDLLAMVSAVGIMQRQEAQLFAFYPETSLPKDSISLRNVGALAADVPCNSEGKLEYVATHAKSFKPELYTKIMATLFRPTYFVGQYLKPFGPRAATHAVFYEAAAGSSDQIRKEAQTRIVKAASILTNGKFAEDKWLKRPMYKSGSSTMHFDGEFLNPVTSRWEDLAKLDSVAVANLLLSDAKAGQTQLTEYRQFAELCLPSNNSQPKLAELHKFLTKLTGGIQTKHLRINDVAFVPLIEPEFLNDLQSALNAVTSGRLTLIAPTVTSEQQRGNSFFSFDDGAGVGNNSFGGGWDNGGNNGGGFGDGSWGGSSNW